MANKRSKGAVTSRSRSQPQRISEQGHHQEDTVQVAEDGAATAEHQRDDDNDDVEPLYDASKIVNRPAYDTKHLAKLLYRVPELSWYPEREESGKHPSPSLTQTYLVTPSPHHVVICFTHHDVQIDITLTLHQSSMTRSTSSSLWLSSQVLAAYLLSIPHYARGPQKDRGGGGLVIELGAGIGFLSLLTAHMGWNVLATDLPDVLQGLIEENILSNPLPPHPLGRTSGTVRRKELDWTKWNQKDIDHLLNSQTGQEHAQDSQAIQLILATDTIYAPHLCKPFWKVFSSLLLLSRTKKKDPSSKAKTIGLIALERRDSSFVDEALGLAEEFGVELTMVQHKKLRRIVRQSLGWEEKVWDGVEIWEVRGKDER